MGKTAKTPARLYKYRGFSNLTLEMLVGDTLYFADASSAADQVTESSQKRYGETEGLAVRKKLLPYR
jgi:hypothetical protein